MYLLCCQSNISKENQIIIETVLLIRHTTKRLLSHIVQVVNGNSSQKFEI